MPDPIAPFLTSTATTRRTVLRAAGLAALTTGGVAVLGACSPAEETANPTTSPASSAPATSAPASSPPASSPSASEPTPSPAEAPSGPSVARSKVPVGGGVILQDADYVITQPTAGEFKAFSKICTHMQCPVGSVEGGTINCPCHGSKYSIEDGSVVNPPAPGPLKEAEVTVSGDRVVVTA
jgi:Rieske Fe-S protein